MQMCRGLKVYIAKKSIATRQAARDSIWQRERTATSLLQTDTGHIYKQIWISQEL